MFGRDKRGRRWSKDHALLSPSTSEKGTGGTTEQSRKRKKEEKKREEMAEKCCFFSTTLYHNSARMTVTEHYIAIGELPIAIATGSLLAIAA